MSPIEKTLRAAKKVQPDLWRRTQGIAKIIDPGAFAEGWVIHPEDVARVFKSRRKVEQANAMHKAQEVLKFLGVNTDTEWFEILKELAKETA